MVIGAASSGCASEGIRSSLDRSQAGAPGNGDAGAPSAGDSGAGGVPSDGEAGEAGEPSLGGVPASGSSGSAANEAGQGGEHAGAGEAGAPASGGAPTGGTPGVDPPGESGAGGTPASGGEGGATPEPDFPCEVRAIIEAKCQRCHQDPPQNGAPFPLLSWSDTRAEYGVQLVYQVMLPAIESDFMPFTELELDPPVQPLTSLEKQTMLAWLESGAAPRTQAGECD